MNEGKDALVDDHADTLHDLIVCQIDIRKLQLLNLRALILDLVQDAQKHRLAAAFGQIVEVEAAEVR